MPKLPIVLSLAILLQMAAPAAETANRLNQPAWKARHLAKVAEAAKGGYDVVFIGDSITQGWETHGNKIWEKYYGTRKALNLGFSGDCTDHVLWRLENGELQNVSPKLYVVMIGTNNTGQHQTPAKETAKGVKAILKELITHSPDAKILLLAVFPREAAPDGKLRAINNDLNKEIRQLGVAKNLVWLDINDVFLNPDGTLPQEIMPDFLHPRGPGYFLWAKAMEPTIKKLLGD